MKKISVVLVCLFLLLSGCSKPNKEQPSDPKFSPKPTANLSEKPSGSDDPIVNETNPKDPIKVKTIRKGRYLIGKDGYSLMLWVKESSDTEVKITLFKQVEDMSSTLLEDVVASYDDQGGVNVNSGDFDFSMKMKDSKLEIKGTGKGVEVSGEYELDQE